MLIYLLLFVSKQSDLNEMRTSLLIVLVIVKMNLLHPLHVEVTSLLPQEFADDSDNQLVLDVLKADWYLNAAALC